jgi:hypothetical protein
MNHWQSNATRERTGCSKSWERECGGCGGTVSLDYARVFSDSQGTLHSCPQCTTQSEMQKSAGAGPEGDYNE